MIELNKKFESDDELVVYFARVIANYCFKVGKCENCVFGLDMGEGERTCLLTCGQLPCAWHGLMRACGVTKDGKENPSKNV